MLEKDALNIRYSLYIRVRLNVRGQTMLGQSGYLRMSLNIGSGQVDGCGKSSTLKKYIKREYTDETVSTPGVDLEIKFIKFNNKYIKVFFWDTAGQDVFHYITTNHFRNANGFILFYDVTRETLPYVKPTSKMFYFFLFF